MATTIRPLCCSPPPGRTRRAIHDSRRASWSTKAATQLTPSTSNKKVLVPIGLGTEEMEAVILADVLRRAGADVLVASVEPELQIEGSSGTKLVADTSISACADEVFDLVALPGGMPGSARLRDCQILQRIITKQAEDRKLYGAICAAPAVALIPWGLMKRKKMTCHPAFMGKLPTFWAVQSNLQVSGELTTSRGPGTTFEFALSFVQQLFGDKSAADIGELLMVQSGGGRHLKKEFNKIDWSFDQTPHGGAAGAERLGKSMILKKLLKDQKESGRIYGGICSAPAILQKHGLLKDKVATAHPSVIDKLAGQVADGAGIVIDGNVITCKGLGTVMDFSMNIVRKLFGHGRARSLAEGIVFEFGKS